MKKRSLFIPATLAVLCAVGVHMVLFTDVGHRLQSSIIESDTTSHAQAHLVADGDKLSLKLNVTADNITGITGTVFYDDESLVLTNPITSKGTLEIAEGEFSKNFTLTFPQAEKTTKGDTLVTWDILALLPESNTINLMNVTLHMTDGDVRLTTEGTGEF